jgi:hypothetical protein
MSTLISDEYRRLNNQLHRELRGYGTSSQQHIELVAKYAKKYECETILDYGCGKAELQFGMAVKSYPWHVHNYDPAIPDFAAPPPRCDMVVCTDVLEHVEPEHIVDVLKDIDRVTGKFFFSSTALVPAKKHLADGRNVHVLLRPPHWWVDMFRKHTTLTITELRIRPIAVRINAIRNEYALSK